MQRLKTFVFSCLTKQILQSDISGRKVAIMSLKKLNNFTYFDIDEFVAKKKLVVICVQQWKDFESKKLIGTKIETVIILDRTDYGNSEGIVNNLYEKLIIKVPAKIDVPINSEIRLINAEATVYGEFRNQLSIVAENVEVVDK